MYYDEAVGSNAAGRRAAGERAQGRLDLTTFVRWALFTSAGQSRHGLRVLGDLVRTAVLATLAVWLIVAGGMFGSLLWVQVWWVYESSSRS